MCKFRHVFLTCSLISFLFMSGPAAATPSDPAVAEVEITAGEIAILPITSHDFQSVQVRIVDPEDRLVIDTISLGEGVAWNPEADSPEGYYHYEVTAIFRNPERTATEEEEREGISQSRQEQISGLFELSGGQIFVPPEYEGSSGIKEKGSLRQHPPAAVSGPSGPDVMETLTVWEDIAILDPTPQLYFDDVNIAGIEWTAFIDYSAFFIYDEIYDNAPFLLMASAESDKSIEVDSNGDLHLANNAFFFDRSETRLGIGTTTPSQDLSILDTFPVIHLEDSDSNSTDFTAFGVNMRGGMSLSGNTLRLFTRDTVGDRHSPVVVKGVPWNYALTVVSQSSDARLAGEGYVGVGTITPKAKLHVKSDADKFLVPTKSGLLVEEVAASTDVRTLLQLKNKGAPRFALENTSSGIEWSFQQSSPGNFLVSKEGTGGPEIQVYQDGRVRMGPGGAKNFDLAPTGNLTIAGSLTANGTYYPSDRNLKKNIRRLDPEETLARVKDLEVSRWVYKEDKAQVDHAGPMAQDFYERFGLGKDDKHLNSADTAGVALAAIQGLYQQLQEKDARITKLEAELEEIRAMLLDR